MVTKEWGDGILQNIIDKVDGELDIINLHVLAAARVSVIMDASDLLDVYDQPGLSPEAAFAVFSEAAAL